MSNRISKDFLIFKLKCAHQTVWLHLEINKLIRKIIKQNVPSPWFRLQKQFIIFSEISEANMFRFVVLNRILLISLNITHNMKFQKLHDL